MSEAKQSSIKIGLQLAPQHGLMAPMRKQWIEAEALGVDALYTSDHFHSQETVMKESDGERPPAVHGLNFEATTIQAAMAATTTRPQIGCLVHAIGYRNPNLLADIARTIDHISGGRYILGLGSGYLEDDYVNYGYEFGTQRSRSQELMDKIPVIQARFEKLNPRPLRKIPFLIAAQGKKIGLPTVARYADIWHLYGYPEQVLERIETVKRLCREIGRDFSEIEMITYYAPRVFQMKTKPDEILGLGIRNIVHVTYGPDWDLGELRELLAWRDGQR